MHPAVYKKTTCKAILRKPPAAPPEALPTPGKPAGAAPSGTGPIGREAAPAR